MADRSYAKACKPNFLVIGSMKCGSSSMWDLLSQHPEVFMVRNPKEVRFFSHPEFYARGWSWYESLFADGDGMPAIGENTPAYSCREAHPGTADRVANHLPDARLIYITRHPFARIESVWIQARTTRTLRVSSLAKALRTSPDFLPATNYWNQINEYRSRFPDKQILVLFLEDLKSNPSATLRRCWDFLGVDSKFVPSDAARPRNVSLGNKRMDRKVLLRLRELPGYSTLSSFVPSAVRRPLRTHLLKTTLRQRERLGPDEKKWIADQIGDDIARFLKFYGKSPDFWSLESQDCF